MAIISAGGSDRPSAFPPKFYEAYPAKGQFLPHFKMRYMADDTLKLLLDQTEPGLHGGSSSSLVFARLGGDW